MNKTAYMNALKAITYAAFQNRSSCICVCTDDSDTSFELLHSAFTLVVDEMNEQGHIKDIDKLYDAIPFLADVDYFGEADYCVAKEPNESILNALLYCMEQVISSEIDVCGLCNNKPLDYVKPENCDALLQCYYHFLGEIYHDWYVHGVAADFEASMCFQYDAGLLKEAMHYSTNGHAYKAMYLVEKAKYTAKADAAWELVDLLYDQDIICSLLEDIADALK